MYEGRSVQAGWNHVVGHQYLQWGIPQRLCPGVPLLRLDIHLHLRDLESTMLFIKDNENNIFVCVDYIPSRIYRYLKVTSEGAFQEVLLIV